MRSKFKHKGSAVTSVWHNFTFFCVIYQRKHFSIMKKKDKSLPATFSESLYYKIAWGNHIDSSNELNPLRNILRYGFKLSWTSSRHFIDCQVNVISIQFNLCCDGFMANKRNLSISFHFHKNEYKTETQLETNLVQNILAL